MLGWGRVLLPLWDCVFLVFCFVFTPLAGRVGEVCKGHASLDSLGWGESCRVGRE